MRKFVIFLCAAAVLFSGNANAQDILESFSKSINGKFVSFDYEFKLRGDVPVTGCGKVCFLDRAYRMVGNGLEICSDGKDRWTVDAGDKEAYVEEVSDANVDFVTNPALLLSSLSTSFTLQSFAVVKYKGKDALQVDVYPAIKGTGLKFLSIYFSSCVPLGATITIADGTVSDFVFKKYTTGSKPDGYSFSFDTSALDKSFVVTDLR